MLRFSAFASLLLSGWLFAQLSAVATENSQPNILWLSCEDISPHLGCYGSPDARTPTLDRLAAQGVRYLNVFTTTPVCATNRSSIITGMYPTSIGTQFMRCSGSLPPQVRCFTEYLREAGYYCTNNSKEDYNFSAPKSAWDDSSRQAHWRNRRPGQPFFAVFNY
ncbi:MAG: sulfatase-like hydrolase/transferase, partial [Planctomycetales bacterium]|nr:sulfatase-like hydrolase/transferase [Planctomycetales bacterium]